MSKELIGNTQGWWIGRYKKKRIKQAGLENGLGLGRKSFYEKLRENFKKNFFKKIKKNRKKTTNFLRLCVQVENGRQSWGLALMLDPCLILRQLALGYLDLCH